MIRIRPATNDDANGIIDLIGRIYGEYDGVVMDLDGIDAPLRAPATDIDRFWICELGARIVGTGGCDLKRDHLELKRMYIDPEFRRHGLGRKLVALVEQTAVQKGLGRVELWSDIRFSDAHEFYQRLGYRRTDETRALHDPSNTVEFNFVKDL